MSQASSVHKVADDPSTESAVGDRDPNEAKQPTARRAHFVCPACGKNFTRKVRLGLYAHCPRCNEHAYGDKVWDDFAKAHAAKVTAPRKRREKPATSPPPGPGGAGSHRAPRVVMDDHQEPDDPAPPPPAAEPPRRGFMSRLLGVPSEDDE